MSELLIELLSEELPARMQARAAEDFRRLVCDRLLHAQLPCERARAYVTPRRLVLVAEGLAIRQPDTTEERKGPRVGAPETAITGFLKATGLSSVAAAEERETEKGRFYFAVRSRPGRAAADVIADVVCEAVLAMPWQKSMRWGHGRFRWARPLHNLLVIFNGEIVPVTLDLGSSVAGEESKITSANRTYGHRFLAPAPFEVRSAADHRDKLEAAKVILDPGRRKSKIAQQASELATTHGLSVRPDPVLLDEVTGLVEWPVALIGRIDDAFLDLPREVLVTSMRSHQKYFALETEDGRLAPNFIVVANMETADGGRAIVAGNERVLRARLSDAKFFWDHDRARPLASRVDKLAERMFHAKLGSDRQRVDRLESLASRLAPFTSADPERARRAARLCKADLTTGMVGEFPELQGVMGRYYALHDGEAVEVADAIAEHYSPLGPNDRCPSAAVSVAVALADKIDTLVGFFGIGEKPTGSGDPYALRRAAMGVIRLITENRLRLPLRDRFADAEAGYAAQGVLAGPVAEDLLAFFADRLKVHLKEQGVRHDLIAAVFAGGGEDDLVRLMARVDALRDFLNTDDGANLLIAYRRASNIVRIEENKDGQPYDGEVDPALLSQPQEQSLFTALSNTRPAITAALNEERFGDAMAALADLRPAVDAFFDHVTVNCADTGLRANRLRLLSQIRTALTQVADFSQIEG